MKENIAMRKVTNAPFYELLKQYPRRGVDYGLFQSGGRYQGELSHREALACFMRWISAEEDCPWAYDVKKAKAVPISAADFFFAPEVLYRDQWNNVVYDCGYENPNDGGKIPYWYAFLESPHGGGEYVPADFQRVNRALFPGGTDLLEIYEWSTDWSEFFDDGHEWWGASCWSVYDKTLDRYAVIMASDTD